MPETSSTPGWHATDDGDVVPINRTQSTQATIPPPIDGIIGTEMPMTRAASGTINIRAQRLAALTGITVVVVATGVIFGVFGLRGSVMQESTTPRVTITKNGTFEPMNLSMQPGASLTIVNENDVPQVIKPADPSQMLFQPVAIITEPVTVTIPTDAAPGTYTYQSSTLDAAQVLSITVITHTTTPATTSTPIEVAQNMMPDTPVVDRSIPLPFDAAPSTSAPATLSVASETQSASTSNETAVISLGGKEASATPETTMPVQVLPKNPNTVANNRRTPAAASSPLHSGAPLIDATTYTRPPRNAETGTNDWATIASIVIAAVACWQCALRKQEA